ncbi:MAG: TatD family hydrolase [Planctomycetia bacterium]|nr:TatD family hydrolase [Planctomycetia bacterium]
MPLLDSHVHLQDKRFTDLEGVLRRAEVAGVGRMITSATSPGDWNLVAGLGRKYQQILATFGIHPWYATKISGSWQTWFDDLLANYVSAGGYRAGVGEIGLDFAMRVCDRKRQEEVFREQLALASERKRPVVIHSVRANPQVIDVIKEYSGVPAFLMHGFAGTGSEVDKLIDLGGWFSFSWSGLTRSGDKRVAALEAVPRDRILLESDGPILMPTREVFGRQTPPILVQELHGEGFLVDEPGTLPKTLAKVAGVKKMSHDDFSQQLALNEKRFLASWERVE